MLSSRIIVTSQAVRALGTTQDNGLCGPECEAHATDVYILGKTGDAPTPPTPAEIYCGGKRFLPDEQVQYQNVNEGVRWDHVYAVCNPVPPDTGATAPRGTIVHKLTSGGSAGLWDIDSSAVAFTLATFTQPAVSATATIAVHDSAGFAVNDVVYLGIGCLYDVTDVAAGSLTLSNRGEAAAAVSTSA